VEDPFAGESSTEGLSTPPSLEQLEYLHRSLTADEREELLECLLIAAARGADCMMQALAPWIVAAAARELLDEYEG
jgi:hypothetical protein